ncbi:hypothetical protein Unana1_03764 [Umbelopsis nana]
MKEQIINDFQGEEEEIDDEGFTFRKSKKSKSLEPPVTPGRKSVFSCITPTALKDIEQVIANGPPRRARATPPPTVHQTVPHTNGAAKRPVKSDSALPLAKKRASHSPQEFTVPLNDTAPTFQHRRGRKSSWMPQSLRASSFATSSFLDRPPPNTKPNEYYLYTSSKIPDPVRMRQVLAWCARTVSDKQWKLGRDGVISGKAASAATHIQDQLIKKLLNGQINTSWYHRPLVQKEPTKDGTPVSNPVNVKHARTLEKWQTIIDNFTAEDQMWSQTAAKYSAAHAKALDAYPRTDNVEHIPAVCHDSWLESLPPIEQQFVNQHCHSEDTVELLQLMSRATENLQSKIDVIEEAMQTAVAVVNKIDRTGDEILKSLSSTLNSKQYGYGLQQHDRSPLSPDPSLLLRLISSSKYLLE